MSEGGDIGVLASSWNSYPKVYALGSGGSRRDFRITEDTVAEEKVDGSQYSFGVIDGELRMRSRRVNLHDKLGGGEGMFLTAVKQTQAIADMLRPGWTYRAEYLQAPRHNVLAYERVPRQNLILFDVARAENDYLSYEDMAAEAERIGVEAVPVLGRGADLANPEFLRGMISNATSCLGGIVEGVVLKTRGECFGVDGKPAYAKYVQERFKEIAGRAGNPGSTKGQKKDVVERIVSRFSPPARFEKAVQRLRESGRYDDSVRDIGPLIKLVMDDIEEECAQDVKDMLWCEFEREIKRKCTSSIPQWYKDRLAEKQGAGDVEG